MGKYIYVITSYFTELKRKRIDAIFVSEKKAREFFEKHKNTIRGRRLDILYYKLEELDNGRLVHSFTISDEEGRI